MLYLTSCDRVCEAHSVPMAFFYEAHLAEVMFRNVDESILTGGIKMEYVLFSSSLGEHINLVLQVREWRKVTDL